MVSIGPTYHLSFNLLNGIFQLIFPYPMAKSVEPKYIGGSFSMENTKEHMILEWVLILGSRKKAIYLSKVIFGMWLAQSLKFFSD